ncbi:MAG: RNA polymerase sigma factor [Lentisphaerae bacterium]|nr:RNA polymerase sigma factor [Lentisphaerota bacterium]
MGTIQTLTPLRLVLSFFADPEGQNDQKPCSADRAWDGHSARDSPVDPTRPDCYCPMCSGRRGAPDTNTWLVCGYTGDFGVVAGTRDRDRIAEEAYEGLYRFAMSLSKCPSSAADLVQQTYLKWVKHRDRIRNPSKAKSWMFTTLYREFLGEMKRRDRVKYLEDREHDPEPQAEPIEAGRMLDGEMAMQALQRVSAPYRATLTLFYVEDLTYSEIAEVLAIPAGTVMSRIHRGRQLLKTEFARHSALGDPHPVTSSLTEVQNEI